MPKLIQQLAERVKGSLGEDEDWWRLMQDDDGALFIEHEWSHTNLKSLQTDANTRRVEPAAFLAEDHPWASDARKALEVYLAEQGLHT
jgi:hypothetical protein